MHQITELVSTTRAIIVKRTEQSVSCMLLHAFFLLGGTPCLPFSFHSLQILFVFRTLVAPLSSCLLFFPLFPFPLFLRPFQPIYISPYDLKTLER